MAQAQINWVPLKYDPLTQCVLQTVNLIPGYDGFTGDENEFTNMTADTLNVDNIGEKTLGAGVTFSTKLNLLDVAQDDTIDRILGRNTGGTEVEWRDASTFATTNAVVTGNSSGNAVVNVAGTYVPLSDALSTLDVYTVASGDFSVVQNTGIITYTGVSPKKLQLFLHTQLVMGGTPALQDLEWKVEYDNGTTIKEKTCSTSVDENRAHTGLSMFIDAITNGTIRVFYRNNTSTLDFTVESVDVTILGV